MGSSKFAGKGGGGQGQLLIANYTYTMYIVHVCEVPKLQRRETNLRREKSTALDMPFE